MSNFRVFLGGDVRPLILGLMSICMAVAFPALAESLPADPPSAKESQQWFVELEPGESLRVTNKLGNVYARFGGYEDKVEILATIQKLDAALPPLEVSRERGEDSFNVTARHSTPVQGGVGDTKDQVDLVIFLPKGHALFAETLDGLIEIKKAKSDVVAASVSGDIRIRGIAGRVRATNASGSISATLNNDATRESQELSTQTGDIEVHVWEDAEFNVLMATSGEISTDFSLDIEHRRFQEPSKHATAVLGAGGPQLHLNSKRGRVRFLRLQKNFKSEP